MDLDDGIGKNSELIGIISLHRFRDGERGRRSSGFVIG